MLALFAPHCLHGGELFKISVPLVFLESTKSGVYYCMHMHRCLGNCL